eukprot:1809543-Pyramimonas_sp.AAC.1
MQDVAGIMEDVLLIRAFSRRLLLHQIPHARVPYVSYMGTATSATTYTRIIIISVLSTYRVHDDLSSPRQTL